MQPTWEAQWEIYCHTNKHTHNQDPEKVQWESRCQFSHAALMRARTVKKSARVFSELRATAFLTASGRNSTLTPEQEPVTCIEKWGNATIMSPLTELLQWLRKLLLLYVLMQGWFQITDVSSFVLKKCVLTFFLKDFNKMWEFFIIRGITDVCAFIVQPVFLIWMLYRVSSKPTCYVLWLHTPDNLTNL